MSDKHTKHLNHGESLIISGDKATIQTNGKIERELDIAEQGAIAMKQGVHGIFIMTDTQAFFFPLPSQQTIVTGTSLFQAIDATRKACLDALNSHQGNGVAEVILISPPESHAINMHHIDPDHSTASYRLAISRNHPSDRVTQKVKQSLSTLGLEAQFKENFQSPVPPKPGTDPVLHIKKKATKDENDEEGGGAIGDGTTKPKHIWSIGYTTETPEDGPITEEVYEYTQTVKQESKKDNKPSSPNK
jgi:hypothetical protein